MQPFFPYLTTTPIGKVILLSLALLAPAATGHARASFFQYLQESASQGQAEAQFVLGLAYRDGWDGSLKSGTVFARWCALAEELGDQRPELMLDLLQKGNDRIPPDGAKAMAYLTQAAAQGNDYARVILGEMLLEGNGVPVNWRNGAEWIRKSATAGFPPAQFRLGVIYLIGDSALPKNEIEALAWFIVAAQAGSKPAETFRDERTQLLGREVARLAVMRSLTLLGKGGTGTTGGG